MPPGAPPPGGPPAPVVEAIALHHSPGNSDDQSFSPLTAVHVANALLREQSEPENKLALDLDYLKKVGLEDRLDPWREAIKEEAE